MTNEHYTIQEKLHILAQEWAMMSWQWLMGN